MSRSLIIRSAITSAFIGGAITWLHGRARSSRLPRHVIPIVTPVITMRFAEEVLERLEHAPGEEVFVVLHTDGGEVAACVPNDGLVCDVQPAAGKPVESRAFAVPAKRGSFRGIVDEVGRRSMRQRMLRDRPQPLGRSSFAGSHVVIVAARPGGR